MTQNIQISKKFNDGTIVVIGGQTAAEFRTNLTDLLGREDASYIENEFRGLVPASAGAVPSAVAQAVQTLNTGGFDATPAPPTTDNPSCIHGPRSLYEGTSKFGKPFTALFCSEPKGATQCKGLFKQPNGSWK